MKWLHRPFELTDMAWHGMTVRIPEESRYFLEEVYGPGWRIPDPDCAQWACPNIEGGFPLNCRYYAYVDIFLAIWRGYKSRAHHQCRQALELAAGDSDIANLLESFDRATESGRQRPPLSASDRMIAGHMAEIAGRETASALNGKDETRLRLPKIAG